MKTRLFFACGMGCEFKQAVDPCVTICKSLRKPFAKGAQAVGPHCCPCLSPQFPIVSRRTAHGNILAPLGGLWAPGLPELEVLDLCEAWALKLQGFTQRYSLPACCRLEGLAAALAHLHRLGLTLAISLCSQLGFAVIR